MVFADDLCDMVRSRPIFSVNLFWSSVPLQPSVADRSLLRDLERSHHDRSRRIEHVPWGEAHIARTMASSSGLEGSWTGLVSL